MTPIPVAFYAPLKSPDHPSPSGDRTMARLLLKGLGQAGFAPFLASDLRTFTQDPAPDHLQDLREASLREAERLIRAFESGPASALPRLWFTYHPYYKAPDWIGPAIADHLGIPYVVAEASRADKRAVGAWAESHEAVEAALARAALIFAMTARDRSALERRQPAGQRIVDLPPFLDSDGAPPRSPHDGAGGPVRLLAVAMMRPGDKLESYRLLAASLALLGDRDWTLTIVGDGTAHREVQALFEPFGARIRKTGRIEERAALDQLYADSDLLVWPAVNEAYGMVLLEAQAMGCPVLAGNFGGVSGVMVPGRTGLMPAAGDAAAFARDLAALIDDAPRRRAMGEAAFDFVRRERSLDRAAHILRVTLAGLVPDLRAA